MLKLMMIPSTVKMTYLSDHFEAAFRKRWTVYLVTLARFNIVLPTTLIILLSGQVSACIWIRPNKCLVVRPIFGLRKQESVDDKP